MSKKGHKDHKPASAPPPSQPTPPVAPDPDVVDMIAGPFPFPVPPVPAPNPNVPIAPDPDVELANQADGTEADPHVPDDENDVLDAVFVEGADPGIPAFMASTPREGAPLNDADLRALLLEDACAVLGIAPEYILGDVKLDRPVEAMARVRFVTAGGFKVLWPPDAEMYARLRRAYGLPPDAAIDAVPLRPLPESAVTGAVVSGAHRYPGGYLRSPRS